MNNNSELEISPIERELLDRRQIIIRGPIDDTCCNVTIAKLLYLNQQDSRNPLSLYIESVGGSINAMLPIFDTFEFVDCPVHTYGLSHVNGTALWLLAAGNPGHRYIQKDSYLTIEAAKTEALQLDGSVQLRELNSTLTKLLVTKTNLTDQDVLFALNTGRSFTSEEAVLAGIADTTFDSSS